MNNNTSPVSALAIALLDFLDMTGGPDGMGTGSGKDPRLVRAAAVDALKLVGINLGQSRPAIQPSGASVTSYIAPNAAREFEDQHMVGHDGRRLGETDLVYVSREQGD